jgi:DNA-binding NarL/FixJ family response regulator
LTLPSHEGPTTCVIADDQRAFTEALTWLLPEHGVTVVGAAYDGTGALQLIEERRPTLAILDVAMPQMGGIEVAREVALRAPATSTILYTGLNERRLLFDALDAGARGFVLKGSPLDDLVTAVRFVERGEVYVDPALATTLIRAKLPSGAPTLSPRERDVLRLLADGRSNEQIAQAIHIAPDTVRTYIGRAMEKLDADTRTQAVAIAIRQSLID